MRRPHVTRADLKPRSLVSTRADETTRADLYALRAETAALVTPRVAKQMANRPRLRADCVPCVVCQWYVDQGEPLVAALPLSCGHARPAHHARPCPVARCRHSLLVEINPETGSVKILPEASESCSLDVADRGEQTLEDIGLLTNLTRERIRQIEQYGLRLLKQRMPRW